MALSLIAYTALVNLTGVNGNMISIMGSSIGGGNILVTKVNGLDVSLTGQYVTLIVLHKDTQGVIAAVTEVLSDAGVNICNFKLSRQHKGGKAVMTIEMEGCFDTELNNKINSLPNVISSTMLLPV